ncbi:S-adenosylmethionine synthase isoform X1 [Patella vulgata]|uniref:S-adenosylmethionine synthase isoform X1 n=2 Tax=Patella vulgata TaxID=6465 RepID=UPI00218049FB|nr:S-adenosylmethionine synthase isoform X1 [Patella vulgata]
MENNHPDTFLFTSESVGEGHPDKLCDQVSDAVLDACLQQDPYTQLNCECLTKTGMVFVMGELLSNANIDYQRVVRSTVEHIGYSSSDSGFDHKTCNVLLSMNENKRGESCKSLDENTPASDQGLMFGYATDETEECMPLTVVLSHQLNAKIAQLRRDGGLPWARPDSKTQVTVEYKKVHNAMVPVHVHTVVISLQHDEHVTMETLRQELRNKVINTVIPSRYLTDETIYHIQPSGRFIIGGPQSDAGLTGRKVIVDSYGGWGANGGGALSGKDGTKIDRCASYGARWMAKSLVKAGLCKQVLVQLAYSIGVAEPVSVTVFSYGTGVRPDAELLNILYKNFDMRPAQFVKDLDLRRPIYFKTSCYGHFGREEFPWEKPKTLTL